MDSGKLAKWSSSIKSELRIEGPHPWLAVAFTGTDYVPGVKEAASEAMKVWPGAGVLWEQTNQCYIPHMGLGNMRNFNVMRAREIGADYLLLLDCDILLSPDALVRMAESGKDITVPMIDQSGLPPPSHAPDSSHRLSSIQFEEIDGTLSPVAWRTDGALEIPPEVRVERERFVSLEWAVLSCLFFHTTAFERLGDRPFSEVPIIRNDEYICLYWRRSGCEIWMDTCARVRLLRPPGSIDDIKTIIGTGLVPKFHGGS